MCQNQIQKFEEKNSTRKFKGYKGETRSTLEQKEGWFQGKIPPSLTANVWKVKSYEKIPTPKNKTKKGKVSANLVQRASLEHAAKMSSVAHIVLALESWEIQGKRFVESFSWDKESQWGQAMHGRAALAWNPWEDKRAWEPTAWSYESAAWSALETPGRWRVWVHDGRLTACYQEQLRAHSSNHIEEVPEPWAIY